MKELYDSCKTTVKVWTEFPDGSHNDTIVEAGYFEAIHAFVEEHVLKTGENEDSKFS
jgi:abhydrolase domain-containing protein 13